MGTRHLIAVQQGGQYKVAQYGQFDGYPEGAGETVLDFLKSHSINEFTKRVKKLKFLDADSVDLIQSGNPEFNRETGADILELIHNGKCSWLFDKLSFAADSVFCEWAYVIDLDAGKFEVFKGFNSESLTAADRFYSLPKRDGKYYPVKLVKRYSLNRLPSPERFLKQFKSAE